jgi:hypothetical protein
VVGVVEDLEVERAFRQVGERAEALLAEKPFVEAGAIATKL